jgi:Protein of unknown function (DUF1592)/Protein of unknown function (DUF1588)/Protein of unknown function (DUF1595)/Protein of unknown function (DUF1585)/Protein of unknown function (DUF1587)
MMRLFCSCITHKRLVFVAGSWFLAACTAEIGAPAQGASGPILQGSGPGMISAEAGQAIDLSGQPKYFRAVRLTNAQWAKSVQEVLKLSMPSGLEAQFQAPVAGSTDFTNNEHLLDVDQRGWGDYRDAAEKLADQVTASAATLSAVYAGTDATGFTQTVGRRAYRRPLTPAEVSTYSSLFASGSAASGTKSTFAKGAALVIKAMLQSPYFLYRLELGTSGAPLDGYEMATKLSLFLRGSAPSDALLDIAPTLTSADAAAEQALKMLDEPGAVPLMRDFQRELLHFDRYAQISKINVPSYTEAMNPELQETSYLFFDSIFRQGLGVRDIFKSTKGFVGPNMAKSYGVNVSGSSYVEQDLGPDRMGYFTQLPYLTLHAFNDEPDSIHRGVSLNLDVLCAPLGPPAAVIPPVPPLEPGQTNRQRISTLTSGCGNACHNQMINPLGFAFEHFDGMGQYRDKENGGLTIDSSGSYAFSDGTKTYQNAAELMNVMASDEQTHLCYAKKLASFGLQRDIAPGDLPWLANLAATSKADGGSVKRIIVELVKSEAFRTRFGGAP